MEQKDWSVKDRKLCVISNWLFGKQNDYLSSKVIIINFNLNIV